jgi:hypothetical protein
MARTNTKRHWNRNEMIVECSSLVSIVPPRAVASVPSPPDPEPVPDPLPEPSPEPPPEPAPPTFPEPEPPQPTPEPSPEPPVQPTPEPLPKPIKARHGDLAYTEEAVRSSEIRMAFRQDRWRSDLGVDGT